MIYRLLADTVVAAHMSFVIFVILGGFLVFRWPRLAWLHVPSFLWGVATELFGWICPLTPLENWLRALGAADGYSTSFVENYILPVLYPEMLFPGGFPRYGFVWLGVFVFSLNTLIYWRLYKTRSAVQS